jgi:hypothetical protein
MLLLSSSTNTSSLSSSHQLTLSSPRQCLLILQWQPL